MILIALGANLPSRHGLPHETLAAARRAMEDAGVRITRASSTWLTAPVPISDQPWYHNEVVAVETTLDAKGLLSVLQRIENIFGRVRTVRNAPRVLDLDLIAYHDTVMVTPDLTLPHPRMHSRAFVLLPMADILPDWTHPTLKRSLHDLIDALPDDQEARPVTMQKTGTA